METAIDTSVFDIFVILILLPLVTSSQMFVSESRFTKAPICNVDERISEECSKEVTGARGKFRCLEKCTREDACVGFSLDTTGTCFLHELYPALEACTESDVNHTYWGRYCMSGSWNGTTDACTCVNGGTGDRCKYPTDCDGLNEAGYAKGRYRIYIDPFQDIQDPLRVNCVINPYVYYANIGILSNEGNMNFNRTWKEYERGFGDSTGPYWIGLKTWSALTKVGYQKLTMFLDFNGGSNVYRVYFDFNMTGAATGYSFTYTSSRAYDTGNPPGNYYCGNCLDGKDLPFSTWDKDNDGDSGDNCASRVGSGWWYSGCNNQCNLLAWGLDDWDATPSDQRFSLLGVDMNTALAHIEVMGIYVVRG